MCENRGGLKLLHQHMATERLGSFFSSFCSWLKTTSSKKSLHDRPIDICDNLYLSGPRLWLRMDLALVPFHKPSMWVVNVVPDS